MIEVSLKAVDADEMKLVHKAKLEKIVESATKFDCKAVVLSCVSLICASRTDLEPKARVELAT